MRHHTTKRFWDCHARLPEPVREIADRLFQVLKTDPGHPSLHFKSVGRFRSVRVGIQYRALAVADGNDVVWFWIGTHAEYDRLLRQ